MQAQDSTHIVLAVLILTHDLLVVSLAQEGQSHTVTAQRRLDDVGNVVLVALLVVVLQVLAGSFLVTAQVIVGTVGNAPQLTPAGAEGELIFDIGGSTGVECQLCRLMVTQTQGLFLDTQGDQPVLAEVLPVSK